MPPKTAHNYVYFAIKFHILDIPPVKNSMMPRSKFRSTTVKRETFQKYSRNLFGNSLTAPQNKWILDCIDLYFEFCSRQSKAVLFQRKKSKKVIEIPEMSNEYFFNSRVLPRLNKKVMFTSENYADVLKGLNWFLGWDISNVSYNWPSIGNYINFKSVAVPNKVLKDSLIFHTVQCEAINKGSDVDLFLHRISDSETLSSNKIKKRWQELSILLAPTAQKSMEFQTNLYLNLQESLKAALLELKPAPWKQFISKVFKNIEDLRIANEKSVDKDKRKEDLVKTERYALLLLTRKSVSSIIKQIASQLIAFLDVLNKNLTNEIRVVHRVDSFVWEDLFIQFETSVEDFFKKIQTAEEQPLQTLLKKENFLKKTKSVLKTFTANIEMYKGKIVKRIFQKLQFSHRETVKNKAKEFKVSEEFKSEAIRLRSDFVKNIEKSTYWMKTALKKYILKSNGISVSETVDYSEKPETYSYASACLNTEKQRRPRIHSKSFETSIELKKSEVNSDILDQLKSLSDSISELRKDMKERDKFLETYVNELKETNEMQSQLLKLLQNQRFNVVSPLSYNYFDSSVQQNNQPALYPQTQQGMYYMAHGPGMMSGPQPEQPGAADITDKYVGETKHTWS